METIYTTISEIIRDDCEYLSKTYTMKGKLGKGAFGTIFEACNNSIETLQQKL